MRARIFINISLICYLHPLQHEIAYHKSKGYVKSCCSMFRRTFTQQSLSRSGPPSGTRSAYDRESCHIICLLRVAPVLSPVSSPAISARGQKINLVFRPLHYTSILQGKKDKTILLRSNLYRRSASIAVQMIFAAKAIPASEACAPSSS